MTVLRMGLPELNGVSDYVKATVDKRPIVVGDDVVEGVELCRVTFQMLACFFRDAAVYVTSDVDETELSDRTRSFAQKPSVSHELKIVATWEASLRGLGAGSFVVSKDAVVAVGVKSTGHVDTRTELVGKKLLGR